MQKAPKALKEIWQLKDKCYEETKNMSSKQFSDHVHKTVEGLSKKYHLRLKKSEKVYS